MNEVKPIKIAILSCNHGHGKSYYDLKGDPLFELVACSLEPDYRDKVGIEALGNNIPLYDTDEELYEKHPDLEAVIIASANIKHFEQVKEACRRGLHIFSMKVPTFELDEYDEMIRLTEEAGVVCQVELEMRHHAEVYRVREIVRSGKLGKILSINMLNYSHNPVWWRPWQCDPEKSFGKRVKINEESNLYRGGALADHPHIFDCVRFITGRCFKTVYAETAPNIRKEVETEDLVRIIGKLDNGTLFSLDPSYANNENKVEKQIHWQRYPRCVEVTLSIVGEKGTLIADLYGKAVNHQDKTNGFYLSAGPDSVGLWNKRMREFYECVRNEAKPPVGLREHRHTIETMVKAYESLSLGKPIEYKKEVQY